MVRIGEHQKAVAKGETEKSKLADHIWSSEGDHMALWEDVRIIDKERGWKKRKIKCYVHYLHQST